MTDTRGGARSPHGRSHVVLTGVAGLAAWALLALSAGPALAATPVAQGSASAVSLTLGGQNVDAGTYRASNDGSSETTSGANHPAVSVLGGQSLIKTGVLAQDVRTRVQDGQGYVAACAGLAGQGASVVGVGDAGSCLVPGQAVTLNAGNLALGNLQLAQGDLLQGFDAQLQQALQPVLAPLTAALQTGLTQAVSQLGLAVDIDLGAVQSSCTAGPGTASGTSRLAGVGASVQVGGQTVKLVDLPADPAPNTHVVTGLGDVAALVEAAVRTQLAAVLANLPGGIVLPPLVDQAALLNNALASVGQQLAPLQANLIDATLNKQTRTSADQIEVTALDLMLLPVAQQQLGLTAFDLRIGTSACGPTGKVAAAPTATPTPTTTPKPDKQPVPTRVTSGLESAPGATSGPWNAGPLTVAGLVALTTGLGGAAWTRRRRRPARR